MTKQPIYPTIPALGAAFEPSVGEVQAHNMACIAEAVADLAREVSALNNNIRRLEQRL